MTAERVNMANPDGLLLSDTDAVDATLTSMSVQRDESDQTHCSFNPPPDQHPHPTSEGSGLKPLPCQDKTMEMCGHYFQGYESNKREPDLVLTPPSVHTASIETTGTHPDNNNGDYFDLNTNRIHEPLHQTSQRLRDTNALSHLSTLTEHTSQEHGQMDIGLNQCDSSESAGFEISQVAHDVEASLINTVLDVMNTERSPDHEAGTLNISTCLTHASSKLDSLEMISNVLDTADGPDKCNSIFQTVNNTSEDSLAYATLVRSCSSVVIPTALNLAEPKVTESESHRINHSIINRMFETKSSTEDKKVQPIADCSSGLPVNSVAIDHFDTEISRIGTKNMLHTISCQAPDATGDLGNRTEETERVSLKFTGTKHDSEVCNDLWLDACQFLAGEEDGGAIFDKCGRSLSLSPPKADPETTKATGFPTRENISIDQRAENWEQFPPIERWSSTDSWASALSDWFQTVSAPPEDSCTSNNTSSTGARLGMAIQDTTVEQRTSPDITNTGQPCMSLNLLEPGANEALDRGLAKSDNPNGTLFKQGDKDCLTSHSDLDRQQNVVTENKVNLSEPPVECDSHTTERKAVADTLHAKMSRGSPGNEVSVGSQHIFGELWSAKLEVDALVTGDRVSQVEEERESNSCAQNISAYTRDKNRTAGCLSGEEKRYTSSTDLHTCPSQSKGHVSSEAEYLKLTQSVKTDGKCVSCSFIEGNGSYSGSNTEDLTGKLEQRTNTTPEFIMPFASLHTGNTFLHQSILKQADADVPHQRIINDNEINCKTTVVNGQKSVQNKDSSEDHFQTCPDLCLLSSCGDSNSPSVSDSRRQQSSNTCNISKDLSHLILFTGERFMVSENKRVAYVTLDLKEDQDLSLLSFSNHVNSERQNCSCVARPKRDTMPHKTSSDGKTRSKHKEKSAEQQHGVHTSNKQEKQSTQEKGESSLEGAGCEDRAVTLIETIVITEKITPKAQGKKKKKHHVQHGPAKPEADPPAEVKNRTVQKVLHGKAENLEVKVASNGLDKPASHLSAKLDHANKNSTQKPLSVRPKVEASGSIVAKMVQAKQDTSQTTIPVKLKADSSGINLARMEDKSCSSEPKSTCLSGTVNDDIKRRRIANDPPGAIPIRTRPQLPAIFRQGRKDGEDGTRRAYSEVVKQKIPTPKEVVVPRVVSEIQAEPVPADPQNVSLWCRFSPVPPDAAIKWTKEGTVLSESRKGEGEDERSTLTILKACSKDLGLYKCSLATSTISVSTSEYHLTSEVLMELVIPSHDQPAKPRIVEGDEENIQCSPLLFKDDFLSEQFFGENQPASIVTEKVHFGEGMHRKAFRTTLRKGKLPCFNPGHSCVLKVHNAIGYGTRNNEELVQKNHSLAVEECHVQNTAREYIKEYHRVAKSAESFGEVPEIIPIYLVHRPSNDIPYATLEEELLGDFVKYSVKDGKEINLMRRDSEAGQKCCAFQHWVYARTEGNLLVTDMQGVGMKLTDVGIATCKKGYKGFKGNCATSFIDQFKALHQCNRYCELLGLKSLQPKPKQTVRPKPKTQPAPKKNPFGSVLNGKS